MPIPAWNLSSKAARFGVVTTQDLVAGGIDLLTSGKLVAVAGVAQVREATVAEVVAMLTGAAITLGALGCTTLAASGVITSTNATEATVGGAGAITTAGGIFATKKIISASTVTGTQLVSTVATGTAPLTVASTTVVANLNAALLNGTTWAAPGAIGGTTPAPISCTTLTANGLITCSATGNNGVLVSEGAGNSQIYLGRTAGIASIGTLNAYDFQFIVNGVQALLVNNATRSATFASSVSCTTLYSTAGYIHSHKAVSDTFLTGPVVSVENVAGDKLGAMQLGTASLDFWVYESSGIKALSLNRTTGAATFTSSVEGPKVRLTPEGGIATLVVADEAISVGHVCAIMQGGTANRVKRCPTSGNENDMPVGVAYSAAAAAGDSFWMVVSGRVGVLPDAGVTAAQGYILTTSGSTAGLAAQAATAPAAATHFKEIGHFITTGSGAGAITDAIVHFN